MTINCKGQLIDLSTPKVMGILNITPNSFFDGGMYKNESEVLSRVEKMISEGATFIDVGAYSSKPSAEFVSEKEEIEFKELTNELKTFTRNGVSIPSIGGRSCVAILK